MKANEFVKNYGWCVAIKLSNEMTGITQDVANCVAYWGQSEWDCLKRLVESYDLVQSRGGLPMAKADMLFLDAYEKESPYWVKMADAIKDMESCL